ncbi:MAG TPA: protein-glutamate O-methyltransferase CheR [bacterium]|nr:protein-glutamate O-methyltransferase CheR [bacterium]
MVDTETENIEIDLLLEAIYRKYGYDFRLYSRVSLKRRVIHRLSISRLDSISQLQRLVLYDVKFFESLLMDLSINVTEMFRDPFFYRELRKEVIPILKTYPFVKIWHAGVASGEEVYSMAIILKEEGLYDKAQIYATDFNEVILQRAKQGIIPLDQIKNYTYNYQKSGGKESFANYYTAKYDSALLDPSLKKNIVFSDHNLATDGVFGEMNLIVCRNVLIYFQRELQNRVIRLFRESLCHLGFLCLGSKESMIFSSDAKHFEKVAEPEKIYRKTS